MLIVTSSAGSYVKNSRSTSSLAASSHHDWYTSTKTSLEVWGPSGPEDVPSKMPRKSTVFRSSPRYQLAPAPLPENRYFVAAEDGQTTSSSAEISAAAARRRVRLTSPPFGGGTGDSKIGREGERSPLRLCVH